MLLYFSTPFIACATTAGPMGLIPWKKPNSRKLTLTRVTHTFFKRFFNHTFSFLFKLVQFVLSALPSLFAFFVLFVLNRLLRVVPNKCNISNRCTSSSFFSSFLSCALLFSSPSFLSLSSLLSSFFEASCKKNSLHRIHRIWTQWWATCSALEIYGIIFCMI